MGYNTKIGTDIELAATFLIENDIVAIPTETVYGLAANALNELAVSKVFAAKKRPLYNPLIVHIKGIDEIEKYALEVPDLAYKLFEAFAPGPLTVILPKKDIVPDITTAGKQNVALRIPNHPLSLALLELLDFPLAAPSANSLYRMPCSLASNTVDTTVLAQMSTSQYGHSAVCPGCVATDPGLIMVITGMCFLLRS
jgi:L-threonylcarbamoyladenylate synthase